MTTQPVIRRLSRLDLAAMHSTGEKIAMFTCYDASFARLLDGAGVDVFLIGDSLGNVIQGHDSTLQVKLSDIIYHTEAVKRGSDRPLIIADMPFGSYEESPERAFRSAAQLIVAGAQMVKLEGGAHMAETVNFMVGRGIPVCGHIGLTPQSVHAMGGYRVQGKSQAAAQKLLNDARLLEEAGASMIVLEAIPAALGSEITASLSIITIGIGAGPDCSGQVLVMQDAFDIPPGKKARFVRNFMDGASSLTDAAMRAVAAIKDGSYPGPEHTYAG